MQNGTGLASKLYPGFAAVLAVSGALGIYAEVQLGKINALERAIKPVRKTYVGIFKNEIIPLSRYLKTAEAAEVGKTRLQQALAALMGEVSGANMEQAKGIERIGTAVSEMDKLTQSNAANPEVSAPASEELPAQASELNDRVGALVRVVSGSSVKAGYDDWRPVNTLATRGR